MSVKYHLIVTDDTPGPVFEIAWLYRPGVYALHCPYREKTQSVRTSRRRPYRFSSYDIGNRWHRVKDLTGIPSYVTRTSIAEMMSAAYRYPGRWVAYVRGESPTLKALKPKKTQHKGKRFRWLPKNT